MFLLPRRMAPRSAFILGPTAALLRIIERYWWEMDKKFEG